MVHATRREAVCIGLRMQDGTRGFIQFDGEARQSLSGLLQEED
jgi:hypothetical protein